MKKVFIDLTSTDLHILKTQTTKIRQPCYITDEEGNITKEQIDVIIFSSNRNPI